MPRQWTCGTSASLLPLFLPDRRRLPRKLMDICLRLPLRWLLAVVAVRPMLPLVRYKLQHGRSSCWYRAWWRVQVLAFQRTHCYHRCRCGSLAMGRRRLVQIAVWRQRLPLVWKRRVTPDLEIDNKAAERTSTRARRSLVNSQVKWRESFLQQSPPLPSES